MQMGQLCLNIARLCLFSGRTLLQSILCSSCVYAELIIWWSGGVNLFCSVWIFSLNSMFSDLSVSFRSSFPSVCNYGIARSCAFGDSLKQGEPLLSFWWCDVGFDAELRLLLDLFDSFALNPSMFSDSCESADIFERVRVCFRRYFLFSPVRISLPETASFVTVVLSLSRGLTLGLENTLLPEIDSVSI